MIVLTGSHELHAKWRTQCQDIHNKLYFYVLSLRNQGHMGVQTRAIMYYMSTFTTVVVSVKLIGFELFVYNL